MNAPAKSRRWFQFLLLSGVIVLIVAGYSNRWLSVSGASIPMSQRQQLPDFEFSSWSGGHWRLSDHQGQVVLLNFWATWCPPCREETPGLVRLSEQYGSKGLVVAGIDMDENPKSAVPAFVHRYGIPYAILLPSPGSRMASSVESLPTSLLVNRNGRVARSYVGAVDESVFAHDVEQLLLEHRSRAVPQGQEVRQHA